MIVIMTQYTVHLTINLLSLATIQLTGVRLDEMLQGLDGYDDCNDCIVMCVVLRAANAYILILLVLLHPRVVSLDYSS